MDERVRCAVLISGRGSNLGALIHACQQPDAPARITLVVANEPHARGLDLAREAGIPTAIVHHRAYPSRAAFEADLDAVLREHRIRLVCLAGFMRVLGAGIVEAWRNRMLNIHPSLLPAFRGLDTHRRALDAGVRFHGCTVHIVRADVDAGPILVQAVVPVLPDDSEATLAERVLRIEHRAYPLALELVASRRVRISGERVLVAPGVVSWLDGLNPGPPG